MLRSLRKPVFGTGSFLLALVFSIKISKYFWDLIKYDEQVCAFFALCYTFNLNVLWRPSSFSDIIGNCNLGKLTFITGFTSFVRPYLCIRNGTSLFVSGGFVFAR